MDFFHCNNCFLQPGPPENRSFWLTDCGHSFCSECADTNDSKCKSCSNECTYLPINNDMPGNLKQFFSDPVKELKKTVKILMIQNKHCKMYMEEYVPKLECKYAQAKMAIEKNKSDLENKEVEIQSLRSQIAKLKAEVDDERKKNGSFQHQQIGKYSPTVMSSPGSFDSNQEIYYTPKSSSSKLENSSYSFMNRQSCNAYTSSSPGSEKNSPCERTPRTPSMRSNQMFNMSISTPPSSYNSDDSQELFSDTQRMPSPMELKMRNYQQQTGESTPRNLQRRNSSMVSNMASPFRSKQFHQTGSDMGGTFFKE